MKLLACVAALAAGVTANIAREAMPMGADVIYPREAQRPSHKGNWKNKHGRKDSWGCDKPEYRHKVTIRASSDEHDDVSDDFMWAMKKANNGGTVHLKEGETYVFGKKMDLTFLNDVHLQLDGEISFTDDIEFWQRPENYFYVDFQNSTSYWAWGGEKIQIYGSGLMNGNGQAWYDAFSGREVLTDDFFPRPILFMTDNATDISISGISFLNSAIWTTFMVRSNNVIFDNIRIDAYSTNDNEPKNSDGFDSYNVNGLSVTNTEVDVGDDCYSAKANSSNIFIQNLWCNNSHGLSMGSLGQYPGIVDIIEDSWFENITMLHASNGARIKAWAGPDVGLGRVSNITWKDMYIENTDWPIVIDQCYFNVNETTCAEYPSRVDISDITFDNIWGTSSGRYGNVVANLVCGPDAVCENILLKDINLRAPNGTVEEAIVVCDGIQGDVGVPCVPSSEVDEDYFTS